MVANKNELRIAGTLRVYSAPSSIRGSRLAPWPAVAKVSPSMTRTTYSLVRIVMLLMADPNEAPSRLGSIRSASWFKSNELPNFRKLVWQTVNGNNVPSSGGYSYILRRGGQFPVPERGLERLTLGPAGTAAEPIVRAGDVRAPAPGEEASGATDEPRRFDPGLLFDVLPDGSVTYSDSAGYSIKLVAGDGAPIGTIARPLTPEPVTRIDLATVGGILHGYEIKSPRDRLTRLASQAARFSRVLDRVTLVVSPRHIEAALRLIPTWWGVLLVRGSAKRVFLDRFRRAATNPEQDPRALVELLWRDEALELLARHNAVAGVRSKPRPAVWDRVCEALDMTQIRSAVQHRLMARAATATSTRLR